MIKLILSLYNYFAQRKKLLFGILIVMASLLAFAASRINFKEDISAFLPKGKDSDRINYAYQHVGATNKLIVSVSMKDTIAQTDEEKIIEAISYFAEKIQQADSFSAYIKKIDYQINQQQILELSQFLVANMPYFLTEADYQRMDTLLTEENIRRQLNEDKNMLMSPMGMVMKQNIAADPLFLSAPVLKGLQAFQASDQYQLYNDFIFSKDRKEGIITIESNFSASESRKNAELLELINQTIDKTQKHFENQIKLHYFGSVDIAVTNANRIKQDSLFSMVLSLVLIISLLIYSFRSAKNLLLMIVSLLFGWLFAIGLLSVLKSEVSLIAVGISSIIIGIAINYPLHFLLHYKHERNVPNVIKDIVAPLTIGNITTVGAFLSLLFINSDAMRDLGLFASLLLAGTICFVLLFLPHLLRKNSKTKQSHAVHDERELGKMLSFSPEKNKWVVWICILLSVVFFFLSFDTRFETNMQKINYMTKEQQADFKKMIASLDQQGQQTVYYVSEGKTLDEALTSYEASKTGLDSLRQMGTLSKISGIGNYLPSKKEQQQRIDRWKYFCEEKKEILAKIDPIGVEAGFKSGAFSRFYNVINEEYTVQGLNFFEPVIQTLADNYIVNHDGRCMVVSILHTSEKDLGALEEQLGQIDEQSFAFDAGSIGRTMIQSLSGDFNTVLFICGFLVFVFLIFTLGRIELTLIAFLPLTIGWFWILGMMNIFDIRFNIVNIILATLIFGQGDDYTIFMTEGLMYEYAYKRKLLASYKNSIILSALIMFIGIGSLIIAKHPALHSLAEVTIIGMGSVVLMTFLFPPLIFKWLTMNKGKKRLMPVTWINFFNSVYAFTFFLLGSLIITTAGFFLFTIGKTTDKKKLRYHKLIHWFADFVIMHIPHVKTTYNNLANETFDKPGVIICNHQSHIDLMCIMMLTPKLVILTNDWVWKSPFYGQLIKYADFYPVSNGMENTMNKLQTIVEKGYSIMVFPEGTRSEDCSILRFHRGAFYMAEQLKLDIIPVIIHGVGHLLPKKEMMLRRGEIHIQVMPRMAYNALGETYAEQARNMRKLYKEEYNKLSATVETADYYSDLVKHNYIYKGPSVERIVRANLKKHGNYQEIINQLNCYKNILVINSGYGEFPLLLSLVYKTSKIVAIENDKDKLDLAANCAWVKENLQYAEEINGNETFDAIVLINPTNEQRTKWENLSPQRHKENIFYIR